ncbi:MAG: acetyl-CoA carboxylase carboxyltransferase subunit alpha [Anaeroplasmataceae bacterium]|nr:acetyl-CoA carboxylase carboxyltransferase subunit alpha [Anaeroplasmataceae bacterium]
MSIEEKQMQIVTLEEKLLSLDMNTEEFTAIKKELKALKQEVYASLSAWDRVCIARDERRVKGKELLEKICPNLFELHGDQYYGDDASIIGGIGMICNIPVTIIAQAKGKGITENLKRNFGMTSPEGFRKALRLAKEAEKFKRPIITIVDTSGAYPGKGAEERGQARAIAQNLMEFSKLKTPIISIVLSEGGSGGALALSVSDYIYMFENAVYSVLSPEGFSSILFKNTKPVSEVANYMKLTSQDLLDYGVIDEIIKEPLGGIHYLSDEYIKPIIDSIVAKIKELSSKPTEDLVEERYQKFRKIGI